MDPFEFLEDLFEPVLIADVDGSIAFFNSSFLTLFRSTPRMMKKHSNTRDYLLSVIPDFGSFYDDLSKSGMAISSELSFYIEGQECTIIVKGVKRDSGLTVLVFKDVTVEKQLNDKYRAQLIELRNTYDQIMQADKLKLLGEMTANISHEINNPLTVAVGNSELISFALENQDLNKEREKIKKFNDNMNNSLERISKIIVNMKEFLHKSEDKKEYIPAVDMIERAIAFTSPSTAGTNIQLKLDIVQDSPVLLVNKVKIEQVLINLIQNAIDAIKETAVKDPVILVSCRSEAGGNYVSMDVSDNGPGISKENRSKIFNTFFTTKEIGKGTGLGLSISNRIIESHQGKLTLLDTDKGAHFRIILPATSIAGHMNGNWEKLTTETTPKVLVVDNELNVLNLCMNFLADGDFHFIGATSADEAYKELERVNVDLIISDVRMPNTDGEAFVRELRARKINVPVLFMTSKDYIDKYKMLKSELDLRGIIIKPFTKEDLVLAIGAAVNG